MIYLDPDTLEITQSGGIACYVSFCGSALLGMIRAVDRDTFHANALAVGLMVQTADGPRYHRNITVAEEAPDKDDPRSAPMPPIVLTPGEYDEEGNQLSPPVHDARYHANFWLNSHAANRGAWKQWAVAWSTQGEPGAANAGESSLALNGIELIDPDSVSSPSNVLA